MLSDALRATGRHHEAPAAAREAVEISRALADDDSQQRDLPAYLTNLATLLGDVGQHDAAVITQQEAVSILSQFSQRDTDHLCRLAHAVRGLAIRQRQAGQSPQAAVTSAECVAICRELVASARGRRGRARRRASRTSDQPDRYAALADSLYSVSSIYARLERHSDVATIGAEAINLCRAIVDQLMVDYADTLGAYRRTADAFHAASDAVAMLRPLAAQVPHDYLADLRHGLLSLAEKATAARKRTLAIGAHNEADAIERTLARQRT